MRLKGFANGWYALAFSKEVREGKRVRRRLMNQDVHLTRTRAGTPEVAAGRWRWPAHERHGVILAWPGDRPAWEVRPIEPEHDALEWSAPAARTWRIRTHPQEIIENTVDVAHFSSVHRYTKIEVTRELAIDGPHLTRGYAVARNRGLLRMQLDITASGVGYSRVQVSAHGLRLRTVVMPTPIGDDLTEVRVVTQIALVPSRAHALARVLPRRLIANGIVQLAASEMGKDFAADIRIWETKQYLDPPRLVAGDGPIGPYRRWARQFYREVSV